MAEITYSFRGMNNVLDPADVGAPDPKKRELVFTEVLSLLNVDPSDTACVSMRPGRVALANGSGYHSGWSNPYNPTEAYYVCNGTLWRMTASVPPSTQHYSDEPPTVTPTFTMIRMGLSDLPMNFVQVNDVVRYSNGVQSGVIDCGFDSDPFLPSLPYKLSMVAGVFEEFYNGRLYALVNNPLGTNPNQCALYCSDPMDVPGGIESMDERHNVVAVYDGPAKGICRVDDGLWVSAGEETFFHNGDDAVTGLTNMYKHEGFMQESKAPYPMIPGTVRPIKAELVGVEGLKGWACIWASTRGVCVGGNGGFFANLTQEQVSYPAGVIGTALVREQLGIVHYVFVLQAPSDQAYNSFLPREVDMQTTEVL